MRKPFTIFRITIHKKHYIQVCIAETRELMHRIYCETEKGMPQIKMETSASVTLGLCKRNESGAKVGYVLLNFEDLTLSNVAHELCHAVFWYRLKRARAMKIWSDEFDEALATLTGHVHKRFWKAFHKRWPRRKVAP